MLKQYLEAGKIVNTHGIKGEVKLQPAAGNENFICQFKTLYIDSSGVKVLSSRVHKGCLIIKFDGTDTVEKAEALRGKTVYFNRDDANLKENEFFLQDLIGLKALDDATGEELGTVDSVIYLPAHDVYVIKGKREILIPAIHEFIGEKDFDAGTVKFKLLEGL
jgi:16S rRNA processing protein RimM